MLPISSIYVGICLLILVFLILRTITYRLRTKVAILDGGNLAMTSAIRIHGNFIETAPFVLAGMMVGESQGLAGWTIHFWGATFIIGRASHYVGLRNTLDESLGRKIGTVITLLILASQGIAILYYSF